MKSTAEKVIVVEISALTAKNKSRTDLVEAKLQYEPLLSITRGEETAKSNVPSFFAHTVYLIAIRFVINPLYHCHFSFLLNDSEVAEGVSSGPTQTLVRILLETGRKHQIRAQMAHIGK